MCIDSFGLFQEKEKTKTNENENIKWNQWKYIKKQ